MVWTNTDFLRFSAQPLPLVGRARPAEVRETRIQFDSRTPLFVARGASHEPITRHLPTRRLSTSNRSNRSIRISSAIFVLVRFAMLRKRDSFTKLSGCKVFEER